MANYSMLYSSRDCGPPDAGKDRLIASGRYFISALRIASCSLHDETGRSMRTTITMTGIIENYRNYGAEASDL